MPIRIVTLCRDGLDEADFHKKTVSTQFVSFQNVPPSSRTSDDPV